MMARARLPHHRGLLAGLQEGETDSPLHQTRGSGHPTRQTQLNPAKQLSPARGAEMLTGEGKAEEPPPKGTESLKAGVSLVAWEQGALVLNVRASGLPAAATASRFSTNSLRPPRCGGAAQAGPPPPTPPVRPRRGAPSSRAPGKPDPRGDPNHTHTQLIWVPERSVQIVRGAPDPASRGRETPDPERLPNPAAAKSERAPGSGRGRRRCWRPRERDAVREQQPKRSRLALPSRREAARKGCS